MNCYSCRWYQDADGISTCWASFADETDAGAAWWDRETDSGQHAPSETAGPCPDWREEVMIGTQIRVSVDAAAWQSRPECPYCGAALVLCETMAGSTMAPPRRTGRGTARRRRARRC